MVARRGGVAVGAHRRLGCATSSPSSTSTDVADSSRLRTLSRVLYCHQGAAQLRRQGPANMALRAASTARLVRHNQAASRNGRAPQLSPAAPSPTKPPRSSCVECVAWRMTCDKLCAPLYAARSLCAVSRQRPAHWETPCSSPLYCVGALTGHGFQGSSSLGWTEGAIWASHRRKPFTGNGCITTDHRVTRVAHAHTVSRVCAVLCLMEE